MKKIYYFSGTGNSKHLAERLAENDQLIAIADLVSNNKTEIEVSPGDIVGIVSPIYFWGLPSIVEEFLSKIVINGYSKDSNPIFIAFTCGGSTGLADKMAAKILKSRQYCLNAAYSVLMPDNYIIMFDYLTPEEKVEPILLCAEVKIDDILSSVNTLTTSEKTDVKLLHRGPFPHFSTGMFYPIYRKDRKTAPFWAGDECISCGLCEQVCPSHTIKMELADINLPELKQAMRPVWKADRCIQCLACLHHCPVKTIQYGQKTIKRGRYLYK